MALGLWDYIVAISVVVIVSIVAISSGLVQQYGGGTGGAAYNNISAITGTVNATFTQNIYDPIYAQSSTNSGFGVALSNPVLTALAFIYGGFASFMSTIVGFGALVRFLLATLIGLTGLSAQFAISITSILGVVVTVIIFRITLVGISAWMKSDILRL